jgi:hypothetical protein
MILTEKRPDGWYVCERKEHPASGLTVNIPIVGPLTEQSAEREGVRLALASSDEERRRASERERKNRAAKKSQAAAMVFSDDDEDDE